MPINPILHPSQPPNLASAPLPAPTQPESAEQPGPLPLSFPSILVNPRLKHLSQLPAKKRGPRPDRLSRSGQDLKPVPLGRRRQQRLDNAHFVSNPHISRPTARDYHLWTPDAHSTFPAPPPLGFPASLPVPPAEPIPIDPFSAAMGAYNRSLKGVRRAVRRLVDDGDQPGPTECFLRTVDAQLGAWLTSDTVWKPADMAPRTRTVLAPSPWPAPEPRRHQPLPRASAEPALVELTRTPHMLSWQVAHPFGRYLVHCVARYYGIVSFSRPEQADGPRVVCMVKAHLPTRNGRRVDGNQSLDTPPTTDIDSELSALEAESATDPAGLTDEESGRSASEERPGEPAETGARQLPLTLTDESTDEPLRPVPDNDHLERVAPDVDELSSHGSSLHESSTSDDDQLSDSSVPLPTQTDWLLHSSQSLTGTPSHHQTVPKTRLSAIKNRMINRNSLNVGTKISFLEWVKS